MPTFRPRHQRRLANCDWMPASYTRGQPSHPRRNPSCWACAHPSIECKCTAPQIETPICTRRTTTHQFFWEQCTCGALGRSPMEFGMGRKPHRTPHFHPQHRHPPGMTLPRTAWVRLNRLCTGVRCFARVFTNGVWPPLRPVSVAQKNKPLTTEAEHPVCPACRSNFRPRKWLKPIARYMHLNGFDQRSASLVISDRGILSFGFHIRHIHLMQFPLT